MRNSVENTIKYDQSSKWNAQMKIKDTSVTTTYSHEFSFLQINFQVGHYNYS